ncbi:replication/maintenance protein RepL [Arsenophonus nasoniae]|uniref:Firmicute plasmid replication protein (RepL) n=1 Tax=Arsenophonus nasoniae TaxID=638 RepID=A0A4P7LCY4_9GAMM|nr:replication/maintenance protein RepL [Arsenophonus nasoniae]QBY46982.1 Firmicute plasmid replication protein (RepL) [Arsenophonus nasoniae]WGM09169.1 replication/maintenance protein RepL [Arsenophonus nasoniae]
MSNSKRVITSTKTVHTNFETGEVKTIEDVSVLRFPKEPAYVKMYIDDLSKIVGISAGSQNVLYELVTKIDYDGIVTITKGTRERIAVKTGLKETTVRNKISDLVASGIIKKSGYCEYEMNPNLFAKGDWHDIYKRRCGFKLEINYSKKGERTLKGKSID